MYTKYNGYTPRLYTTSYAGFPLFFILDFPSLIHDENYATIGIKSATAADCQQQSTTVGDRKSAESH